MHILLVRSKVQEYCLAFIENNTIQNNTIRHIFTCPL
jgi:hypothetical protein